MLTSRLFAPGLWLLGLALFAYTAARAALLAFTNDESLTYIYHVRASLADIVNYNIRTVPNNNHLLNTLLMKLLSSVLGQSELVLRLPNVLAHLLFLAGSFTVVRRYVPPLLVLPALIVLNVNPYLLEFFSLARGYGLGLGLMIWSLYFCLRYVENPSRGPLHVFLASLCAALASVASIPFLNVYVALLGVLGITMLGRLAFGPKEPGGLNRRVLIRLREFAPLIVNSLLLAAVLGPPILKLKGIKSLEAPTQFYIGGKTDFWNDTVLSLIRSSLYYQDYIDQVMPVLAVVVMLVTALSCAQFVACLWRRQFDRRATLTLTVVPLTFLAAASTIVQHHLLGINYLTNRIAIMFVPLFALLLINGMSYLAVVGRPRLVGWLGTVLLAVAALAVCVHAANSLNLTHSLVLRGNSSTKQMIEDLSADSRSLGRSRTNRVRLAISSRYKPVVTYYQVSRNLNWLKAVELSDTEEDVQYLYYEPDDESVVAELESVPLRVYPITNAVLARRVHG